jgi:hypothetical protein
MLIDVLKMGYTTNYMQQFRNIYAMKIRIKIIATNQFELIPLEFKVFIVKSKTIYLIYYILLYYMCNILHICNRDTQKINTFKGIR